MGKRRFELEFLYDSSYEDSAVIELDEAVIEAVDDEWRAVFYDLRTPEAVAKHIGYNLIVNRLVLSQLDGWADQPDANARAISRPDLTNWDIEVAEIEIEEGE